MNTLFKSWIAGSITTSLMAGMLALSHASFALAFPQPTAIAQSASLSGSWKLVNMTAENSPMPMLPVGEKVPIADFANGKISGSGGCNRFIGSYETKARTINVSPLGSTFMACDEAVMTQELRFLTALQGAQRYEVDQGQLTIFYENERGAGVLRFASQNNEPVQGLW